MKDVINGMTRAGNNERIFRETFSQKFGVNVLRGKVRLTSTERLVEVSSDESFVSHDRLVLVEIDSGNAAKLLVGEYILLNELIQNASKFCSTYMLVVHFYKNFNPSRTANLLSYLNDKLYAGHGMPFSVLSWPQLNSMICESASVDSLTDSIFANQADQDSIKPFADHLRTNDRMDFPDKLLRARWASTVLPADWSAFHGGMSTLLLFEEMHHSFVHGNFIASTVLGMSFIEHTLAAILYSRGTEEAASMGYTRLVKELAEQQVIDSDAATELIALSSIRNRLIHFRSPSSKESIEMVALQSGTSSLEVWEVDARRVVSVAGAILQRFTASF